jgi:phenylacetic acid degradation operon negative regulatory protein
MARNRAARPAERYVPGVTTSTAARAGSGPRAAQPRALIVTIYGLYAREAGGWLSVAALIRLMAAAGADEPAVRSSISRLKQRGILEPVRAGAVAGYALSGAGTEILAEGDRRIFERPRAVLSDGWLLAVFSVPEQERRRRHALRSRLTWLGFGTVSAGVWIAPGHLAGETSDVLRRHGLSGYVDLFRADYLAFGEVRELIGQWWDLRRLAREYRAFLAGAAPVLARWEPGSAGQVASGSAERGQQAFADYVGVLTAWRRLPFLDPGLPAELLPGHWPGLAAAEVFAALRERLAEPARAHVLAVTGRPQ